MEDTPQELEKTIAERVADLLRIGLDAFGVDDVDGAISAWQQVLELDPDNADAADYINAAGRQDADPPPAEEGLQPEEHSIALEGIAMAVAGERAHAYEVLEAAATSSPTLELEAAVELARMALLDHYRDTIGPSTVPVPRTDAAAPRDLNLPTNAGFLLSLVDGQTPVSDLVSLSGMDGFDALHSLCGLVDAGLVSFPS